jgi:DNA-binding beta-propeller fold protein YncE
VSGDDNTHFGWGSPRNVAVDSNGNVYVADTNNHRIQIYNSSGSYVTTLGSAGSGNYQFDAPNGVAVDGSGNIYVADSSNHRVQIYNSSRVYQADTLTNFSQIWPEL